MSATIEQLATRLAGSLGPTAGCHDPALYRTLLRLLADGEPVSLDRLAVTAGRSERDVERYLAARTDTEYDQAGRIVGAGLTLLRTPHRFTVAGRTLYTWCALDTVYFPRLLNMVARIQSPCLATGRPVRLTVNPANGIGGLDPPTTVVSVVVNRRPGSTRAGFCNHVHFFADPGAADGWLADHPDGTVLSIADAWRLTGTLAEIRGTADGCCDTA